MALAQNNFQLLSTSQEPSQLIAQATNTAKNRKKKAKGKKNAALENGEATQPYRRDSNDLEKQVTPAQHTSHNIADVETLQRRLAQDAQNRDCWRVWEEWVGQAKVEGNVQYKDGKGNSYTFHQVLTAGSALPRSVSNAVYRHMTPSDRDLLRALLKTFLPAVEQPCKQLAAVVGEVSQQLDGASGNTKDAAASALEGALKSFFRACEATADSGMPDLDSLDKEIAAKQPLLQKAISQPDNVQAATVDMAMQVVQLLHRKYEGEQCLSDGLAPSICAAAKADIEQLSSILARHASSSSPTPVATKQEPSNSREVESAMIALTQRIAKLESELTDARAQLRNIQSRRSRAQPGKAAAATHVSQSDKVLAAKHAAQRLESIVMEVARLPVGESATNGIHRVDASSADIDNTLMQLLDFSTHTAQMQDKLMDKLAEQLEFARARLVSASNMKNENGITNARKLFSNVRAASSETHDSAARLEALVASLESAISSSPSFSTLRPMAMQVKQIAWQVYNSHNHLSANARPDAILEAASNTKGAAAHNITLDEILQMDVGNNGKTSGRPPQHSTSSALSADPTAPASHAATQGSPAPSTVPPAHLQAMSGGTPSMSGPMSMPPGTTVHPDIVFNAPMANQQAVGMPGGFVGGVQPMHTMIVQPEGVPVGMTAPTHGMLAQPVQPSMPLQQYVPGQLFAQDAAQMGMAVGPPPGIAAPVAEPAQAPSRFDSQIAAAEAAAANLAKVMGAKPAATRGRGGGRRGAAAVRGRH